MLIRGQAAVFSRWGGNRVNLRYLATSAGRTAALVFALVAAPCSLAHYGDGRAAGDWGPGSCRGLRSPGVSRPGDQGWQPADRRAAGRYRVTPRHSRHLLFKNLADIEIVAQGVEMVCSQTLRAIDFEDCRNLRFQGLTIDYDPLPFYRRTHYRVGAGQGLGGVRGHRGLSRQQAGPAHRDLRPGHPRTETDRRRLVRSD